MTPTPNPKIFILFSILMTLFTLLWLSGSGFEAKAYTGENPTSEIRATPTPTPVALSKHQREPEDRYLGSLIFRSRPRHGMGAQPASVTTPRLDPLTELSGSEDIEKEILYGLKLGRAVNRDNIASSGQAERSIVVNQDRQKMYIYEDDIMIRVIPVSTGSPALNSFTPAWNGSVGSYMGSGGFRNTTLRADYMWYLFPGVWGSILIHSVPYTLEDDEKVYDRLDALGVEPTSHGCVRISPDDAAWLKTWNPTNVSIEITHWSGQIGPSDPELPAVSVDTSFDTEEALPRSGG